MAVFSVNHFSSLPSPASAPLWKTLTRSPLSDCSPGGNYRLQIQASSNPGRAHGPLLDANSMTRLRRRIEELRERKAIETPALTGTEQEGRLGVVDDDDSCDVDDDAENDFRSSGKHKKRHGGKSYSHTSCSLLQDDKRRLPMMKPSGEELYWCENNLPWMDWEVKYRVFYQEEVMCMMARLQRCLLECRPSRSLLLLLFMCLCVPVGAFHILLSLISFARCCGSL